MKDRRRCRIAVVPSAAALVLLLAAAAWVDLEASKTSPEDGATLSGPVRTLRVWFNQEPVLPQSKLELEGPAGPMKVEGLHTMGEKDLMARVSGRMPDGSYTARWRTAGDDGQVLTGEWTFTVDRAAR